MKESLKIIFLIICLIISYALFFFFALTLYFGLIDGAIYGIPFWEHPLTIAGLIILPIAVISLVILHVVIAKKIRNLY